MDVSGLPDSLGLPATSLEADAPQIAGLSLGGGWIARVLLRPKNARPVPGLNGAVLTRESWLEWLSQPLRWFPPADKRNILKTSSTTLVGRAHLPLASGGQLDVVCKRRVPRQLYKRLLAMVRISRPRRTWQRATALLDANIPTARPLAIIERRRFGLLVDSLIITEYLDSAVDLESLLTVRMRTLTGAQTRRLKHELCDAMAGFVLRLQNAGFVHRDFKALNVIVQWDPAAAERPRITVVDLDGIRKSRTARAGGHRRMLMRLNVSVDAFRRVSLTDRARLLQRYLARAGRPTSEWKSLWRELAAMSNRKRRVRARHQERSFRKYGRF